MGQAWRDGWLVVGDCVFIENNDDDGRGRGGGGGGEIRSGEVRGAYEVWGIAW